MNTRIYLLSPDPVASSEWEGGGAPVAIAPAAAPATQDATPANPHNLPYDENLHTPTPQPDTSHRLDLPVHRTALPLLGDTPEFLAFKLPEPLPTDLAESRKLVAQVYALRPVTRAGYDRYREFCEKVRKHHQLLENGPAAPIDHRPIFDVERASGRAAAREKIIASLEATLKSKVYEDPAATVVITTPEEIILEAVNCPPFVRPGTGGAPRGSDLPLLLCVARPIVANYALVWFGQQVSFNAADRIEEIQIELQDLDSLDPATVDELQSELLRLGSGSAHLVAQAANARINAAFEPLKFISQQLLEELALNIESLASAKRLSEEVFFKSHGEPVPPPEQSIAKRYNIEAARFRDLAARIAPPDTTISHKLGNPIPATQSRYPIHPGQTIPLGVFGLQLVPGLKI